MATESPDDENLLLQIQEGDNNAFATLVKKHSTKYYNLAFRYMLNREAAEDIVQTAFLKLFENPGMWSPKKGVRFTTWFYRIVVNLCLDSKKKFKEIQLPEIFEISDDRPHQEEETLTLEAQSLLAAEIASLPGRQKSALILCFYEGMSHKEAAEILAISVKAFQSLLMRAKERLKTRMKDYLWDTHE